MAASPPTAVTAGPSQQARFEDFSVGQRLTVRTRDGAAEHGRERADDHGATNDHGATAVDAHLAPLLSLLDGRGAVLGTALEVTGVEWSRVAPTPSRAAVLTTLTVTGCHRLPGATVGSVRWHVRTHDEQGKAVHEGGLTVLVEARPDAESVEDAPPAAFCTHAWGQALASRLGEDPRFAKATATWDGSIGLRSGRDQVQLRVYRGRVVDVATRTPLGATFTVEADAHTWTDLLTGPSNDFLRRVMSTEDVVVTGSAYEYLRMTKGLLLVIDAARDLTAGART